MSYNNQNNLQILNVYKNKLETYLCNKIFRV